MNKFKRIPVEQISENMIKMIGTDWMLIGAEKNDGTSNAMTASWGGMGVMWRYPVFACFVRPQRYTYEFTEDSDIISLSFFDDDMRDALKICGTLSGRDCNKFETAGITCRKLCDGGDDDVSSAIFFDEARLVVVGRKIYTDTVKPEGFVDPDLCLSNYKDNDYHKMYVCRIEGVLERV